MHALVVEDSLSMRRIECSILSEVGYSTSEAADGAKAIQALIEGPIPDLILVDWNMPEMNGLELIQKIRGNELWDRIDILMVTTESMREHVVEALEAGATEYLMKPFSRDCLLGKLCMLEHFQACRACGPTPENCGVNP